MHILGTTHARAAMAAILFCIAGTVSAAGLDLFTSPRGGEVFMSGQHQQVRIAKATFKSNVLIELSIDGGTTFTTLDTIPSTLKTSPKEFLYDFVVPATPSARAILQASTTSSKGKVSIRSQQFVITTADLSAGVQVSDNGVGTPKLADGSVTTPKLADLAVTSAKLGDSSVIGAKLAPKSVTADKMNSGVASSGFALIADGSGGAQYQPIPPIVNSSVAQSAGIQYSKLNLTSSISSSDIKDGTIIDADVSTIAGIQYSKLNLTDSIVGTDIKDGAIGYSKLNLANSIGGGDIKPDTIVDANVAPNAGIQYSKLNLANSIATGDLADGSVTNAKVSPTAAIAYTKLNLNNSIVAADLTAGAVTLNKIATTGATTGQALVYNGTSLVFSTVAGGGGGSLTLPFASSVNFATPLFDLTNTGDASAGSFAINSVTATSSALVGKTTGVGDGVLGQSATGSAIHGKKAGTDTGIAGLFDNANAANGGDVLSISNSGTGTALHSVSAGTSGAAAALEVTNAANAQAALVLSQQGVGAGITINVTRATNVAPAINSTNSGLGDGIVSTTTGGDALVGYANTTASLGLYAANNVGGVGATVESIAQNQASLQAVNYQTQGIGAMNINFGEAGFSTYAYCGVTSANATTRNNTAGHFDNRNPTNTRPTVEVISNSSSGAALSINDTGAGGAAIRVIAGALAFGSTPAYAGGVVNNAYLVVTTAGNVALPVTAPVVDGATVWVVNNSGGNVLITNTTDPAPPYVITTGHATQFIFISAVSPTNWIPVK